MGQYIIGGGVFDKATPLFYTNLILGGTMKLYIANDVETAGPLLGVHSMLSLGACVILPHEFPFDELVRRGRLFYAEFKPISREFTESAMRIGCLGLHCIAKNGLTGDSRYDPTSPEFEPYRILELLNDVGEDPKAGMEQFIEWVGTQCMGYEEVIGVTDTVFFDAGQISYYCNCLAGSPLPYGWGGIDLDSLYRGYDKCMDSSLKRLGILDDRRIAHGADYDAAFLAKIGRELIFRRIG